jgi:predicted nuclease of predicted toxin-antitoxin system
VNPLDFPLVADENIPPDVITFLRKRGSDVQSTAEEGLFGQSDVVMLRQAHGEGRVVLTHDGDSGTLAIAQSELFTGIIYLRPGHIRSEFTIQTLETIATQPLDIRPPFIMVAKRRGRTVRIRVRQL